MNNKSLTKLTAKISVVLWLLMLVPSLIKKEETIVAYLGCLSCILCFLILTTDKKQSTMEEIFSQTEKVKGRWD